MPTNAEYLAQGKTQEEINKAVVNKNSQAIATKLGQTYDPTSGQFNVTPAAPIAPPAAPSDIGGLTQEQASGIQDIYKENIAGGMTHEQSQAAIKADPNFAKAKEAFNAPVAPVTPTPEVVTPKPTKDVTSAQKTAKNEGVMTQAEYDKSPGRELEIQTNLTTITAGNPDLLTNRADYAKAFSYQTADAGKKAFLDSFFNEKSAMMTSPDAIFKQLSAGVEVSPAIKNSPAYKTAQARLDYVNKFSAYTPTQISAALLSGDIIPGRQSYKDLMANPVMKQKLETAQKLSSIKEETADMNQVGEKLTEKIMNSPIGEALADNYLTQEEKDSLINTAELKQAAKALQDEKLKLNTLESEYKGIEDDIRKKMEGTGASSTDIAQMIANAQKTLRPRLELAQNNYSTNYGFYTEKKQDSMALFADNLGMYKEEKASKEALAKEARAVTAAKDMAQFEAKLGLETEQASFEQQVKQKAELATNPVLATQEIIESYRKMGVMAERSDAEIIASVQQDIASGKTLGESLTALNKGFQSKPLYKSLMAPKTELKEFDNNLYKVDANGNMSLAMKGKATAADMKYTKLDDGLYQDPEGNIVTKAEIDQDKLLGNKWLNMEEGTDAGVECGVFSSRGTGLNSTPGGNNLDARKKAFSSQDAVPGGIVLFTGGGYDKTYGHLAIVTSVNQDGTINVKESNFHGDNKVTERKNVPKTFVSGFYNNTPLAGGSNGGSTGSDKFLIFENAKAMSGTAREKYLAESGLSTKDFNSINEEVRGMERKNSDISNTYRSLLALGAGVSNSDKQDLMQSYFDALYTGDRDGMITATKSVLRKNKDVSASINSYETTVANLTRMTNGIEKYVQAGGKTDILTGSMEQMIQKIGDTSDTNLAEIKAGMEQMLVQQVRLASGVGVSDTERRFLEGLNPSIKNVSSLNNARIKAIAKGAKDSIMGTLKAGLYGNEEFLDKHIAPDFLLDFTTKTINGTPVMTVNKYSSIKDESPIQFKSTSGKTYNF